MATVTSFRPFNAGSQGGADFTFKFSSTYVTDGETLNASSLTLSRFTRVYIDPTNVVIPVIDYQGITEPTSVKVKAYAGGLNTNFVTDAFPNLAGSANTNSENVDAAAAPTNGTFIAPFTAVAAGAWTVGAITNPDVRRNLCIVIRNMSGGALNLFEGVMTFTVTGTKNGSVRTVQVTFTSNAGNKSVANNFFRMKYSTTTLDTITGVTLDNVPANGFDISVGIGSFLGLSQELYTPALADIKKVTLNAADFPGFFVDTTFGNPAVLVDPLANGDDVRILYQALGGQIAAGTNLSELTFTGRGYGY